MSEEFAPFRPHFCCSSEGGKFFFSLPKKREVTLKLPFLIFLRTALGPLVGMRSRIKLFPRNPLSSLVFFVQTSSGRVIFFFFFFHFYRFSAINVLIAQYYVEILIFNLSPSHPLQPTPFLRTLFGCLESRHKPSFFSFFFSPFATKKKKTKTGGVAFERPLCAFYSLNGKYMKLVLLHLARCVQIRSCFKNNIFLLHDSLGRSYELFVVLSFLCFLLLLSSGWLASYVGQSEVPASTTTISPCKTTQSGCSITPRILTGCISETFCPISFPPILPLVRMAH